METLKCSQCGHVFNAYIDNFKVTCPLCGSGLLEVQFYIENIKEEKENVRR